MAGQRAVSIARVTLARAVAAAAAALTAATLAVLPPAPAGAAEEDEAPLAVELTELSPATIPAKGRIVLAGTVTNESDETWAAVNAHPVISSVPMTTREELTAAADSEPTIEIGTRLFLPGQFATIGDLAPGQTGSFRISLRSVDLPITRADGVYWIGIHALGQNAEGRDDVADGRVRTFIPLVSGPESTSVAIVVPIRERVRRDHLGRLLSTSAWSETLGDDGRLERIAALLNTTDGAAATLLVDPAVLDAVASVAADNPRLSLGEGEEPEPSDDPSQTPGETPGEAPDGSAPGTASGAVTAQTSRSVDRLEPVDRENATRWLAQVKEAATAQTVLGLGYADPDVAALARLRPPMLATAAETSATAFERLGIPVLPAASPPAGWLDDEALAAVPREMVVLVSDHSAPRTRNHWHTPEGQDLVFTDAQAGSGGPGPTPAYDALAVRQRIVSDAALRAQDGAVGPMVVELPAGWDPGEHWQSAAFFSALDLPWLDLVPLQRPPAETPTFNAALGYPGSERRNEVGLPNVEAARTLITTGTVLDELLRSENDVRHALTGTALAAVSYHARRDPLRARAQVLATDTEMRDRMGQVSVIGTDFVTLSGGSGTLTVTLVNQLDQPVTVGIRPRASSPGVRIETPEPLQLAPGQREVLRLRARAAEIGVHEVTLTPVTEDGASLGTPLTFSLRTSQVGRLIWAVVGGGAALLLVMITLRIRRGLREHRWRGQ